MLKGAKLVLQFLFIVYIIIYRKWTNFKFHKKKITYKSPKIIHYIERNASLNCGSFQAMKRLVFSLRNSNFGQTVMILPVSKDNKSFSIEAKSYNFDIVLFDLIKKFDILKILRLKNRLQQIDADIIHFYLHDPYACNFALMSAVLSRIPFIIATEHIHAPEDFLVERRKKERIRKKLLSKAIDKTIAVSRSVRTGLIDEEGLNSKNIVVIPNSVDTKKFKKENNSSDKEKMWLNLPTNGHLIGTVARLHPKKGHIYLMEASKEIILRYPQTIFLFAGDGPISLQLRDLSKKMNIDKHIVFLGAIEEIKDFYKILDLFVLPSTNEGLPLSILEAMAMELPVIATRIDGNKEAVEDGVTGLLVPPKDSKSLARAILEIMEDRKRGIEMGRRGRERVIQLFDVNTIQKKTISVYNEFVTTDY